MSPEAILSASSLSKGPAPTSLPARVLIEIRKIKFLGSCFIAVKVVGETSLHTGETYFSSRMHPLYWP